LCVKPIYNEDVWIVKLLYEKYNYDLFNTLINLPYANKLKSNEESILINIIKSLENLIYIYICMYVYQRSQGIKN